MVRVNSSRAVLPSSGLAFMVSFLHVWMRTDASQAMGALWITLAGLVVVRALPVDLFWVGKAFGDRGNSVRLQETMASHNFLIGGGIDCNKILAERCFAHRKSGWRWIFSFGYLGMDDLEFSRCKFLHHLFFVKNASQVPIAQCDFRRCIIDLEPRGRHA